MFDYLRIGLAPVDPRETAKAQSSIVESDLKPAPNVSRIRLDASKVKTQIADRIHKPGGVRYARFLPDEMRDWLFNSSGTKQTSLKTVIEKSVRLDGYAMLVGQIPVTAHTDDRFELEHFDRTGNQLRVVFRQHTTNPKFSAVTNWGQHIQRSVS